MKGAHIFCLFCQNPLLSISLASPHSTVARVHCLKMAQSCGKNTGKSDMGLTCNLLLFFEALLLPKLLRSFKFQELSSKITEISQPIPHFILEHTGLY